MGTFLKLLAAGLGTIGVLLAIGSVRALPSFNAPATYRLLVVSKTKGDYVVQIRGAEVTNFPVARDGSVTIDIPMLPRRCSWVCFGLRILDGSPKTRKLILVLKNEKVVRRLSVRQIEDLEPDASGVRHIKV